MFGKDSYHKRIGDVCTVVGGSTPSRKNKAYWDNGKIPWFTIEDIYSQGKYISNTKQHITDLAAMKTRIFPKDTVMICCTASLGESAICMNEMASNQQFNGMIINDKSQLHPYYLLYVASSLKDKLLQLAGKTTINFVSRAKLENIEIPIPKYEKQLQFISIIHQADKSKFIDFKSQFIEMISDAPIKKLIEVVKHSGEYGSNTSATIFDGQIRYVRITDITSEGDLNDNIMSPVKIEDKYLLEKDDILFARTGNTVGKTYLHKNGKMLYAGYLIRYRLDESIMFPQFLFSYTHTSQYYNWIDKTKKVGAQPNISAAQYDSMPVPVPILSIQHQFNKIAEQADKSKLI